MSQFNAFIVDTGSGHHLVGKEQVPEKKLTKVASDKAFRLRTANGITTSVWKTRVYIKQLNILVDAWVLEDTPLVLLANKLIEENGFDFTWKASTRIAILSNIGKRHTLTRQQGVPLLLTT